MFIPIFIAILMGLISPNTHNTNCNGGTVYVNASDPNSGGDPDPDPNPDPDPDPNDPGDGTGIGPGGTGTGGGVGQNPPKLPIP